MEPTKGMWQTGDDIIDNKPGDTSINTRTGGAQHETVRQHGSLARPLQLLKALSAILVTLPGMASLPSFPNGQQYRKRLSLKGSQVSLSDTFWDSHIFV